MSQNPNNRTTLFVVIIIIGLVVLAAIALPSFLNQANRAGGVGVLYLGY